MSEKTGIEWCDSTWNPWIGCTKVSPGCANCYAETLMDTRYGKVKWGKGQPRQKTSVANWKLPVRWNKQTERDRVSALHSWPAGKPMPWTKPRVFCASLADWLDDEVPVEWLADLLSLIRATPNLDWLLLTKRPENFQKRMQKVVGLSCFTGCMPEDPHGWAGWLANRWLNGDPPENIWLGTTVENQAMADKRIPALLRIPAKVRFLSCEPLLGEVSIHTPEPLRPTYNVLSKMGGIDWLICGGESGPLARPMRPGWARSLRDQCAAAGVPFFMKQMGGTRKPFSQIHDDLNIRQFPTP